MLRFSNINDFMNSLVHQKFFKEILTVSAVVIIFFFGVLRQVDLPGFYMDSVNPDYMAAQYINQEIPNAAWRMPTVFFPILGNYYHGVQNFYVDLVVFKFLGISAASVRIAQALFGALIVACLYLGTVLATRNRLIAFLAAVLLATDIAFLASFRTQFYIILGGEAWLFASLVALWRGGRLGYLLSGLFFGLAIYGYFVLGFFGPALMIFLLSRPDRRISHWVAGLALGMLPYVVGYASFIIAAGGVSQAIETMRQAIGGLAPMSSKLSFWGNLNHVLQMAILAVTNVGNELMIFNEGIGGRWSGIKVWMFVGVFVGAALLVAVRFRHRPALLLAVLLPPSYIGVASVFGSRLWVHHLSVLVPIGYLLIAVAFGGIVRGRLAAVAAVAVAAVMVVGNVRQASHFHERLAATGGVGKASNALSRLAEDALTEPDTLYVFPEWGFFMPFNLLTANRVPYILDPAQIDRANCRCGRVVLAFWAETDVKKYVEALTGKGLQNVETRVYAQRDGRPAFHVAEGRF
ncbi:glycosyltransferase family 39 protein [Azospirillum argentinense]